MIHHRFFVPGTPVPKGSAKAFVNKYTGRAQVMQDNREKQKPWASLISFTAQEMGATIIDGPVYLSVMFTMPRLKGHFGTGRNADVVKDSAPIYHTAKPDLDKLIRCVKDALTGVCWKDDSQVCIIGAAQKIYGDRPGALITVRQVKEGL